MISLQDKLMQISSHREEIVAFFFLFFLAIFVPTNGIGSTGIMFVLAWVLFNESDLRRAWWKSIRALMAVVLVYFLIMTTYAFSVKASLHDGGEVLKSIALSLVVFYILKLSEVTLRKAMQSVLICLVISTSLILVYNLQYHGVDGVLQRHELDWYVNRNRLAVGFSLMFIFALTLVINETVRLKSFLLSCVMVLAAVAALLNDSRGAIVAMFVSSVSIVLFALFKQGAKEVLRFDWLCLPTFIAAIILGYVFINHLNLIGFVHHEGDITTYRSLIWQTIWERLQNSIWVGYGPHAIMHDHFLIDGEMQTFRHPHSIYMSLLYSSGIVGIVFWFTWFSIYLSRSRKIVYSNNDIGFYIGLGILVNALVHGLVDFDFYALDTMTFLIVGITLVAVKSKANFKSAN